MKLHNKGERSIHVDGGFEFKPDAVVDFPDAIAEKLLALFAGEVFNLELVTQVFEVSSDYAATAEDEEAKSEDAPRRGRPRKE